MEIWKNDSQQLPYEKWRKPPDLDGYVVSNMGRYRNVETSSIVRQYLWGRYLVVHLWIHGKKKCVRSHNLIMSAFKGVRPDGLQINHINGIRIDNRIENLEYCTALENIHHGIRLGLVKVNAEENPRATLTNKQVLEIFKSTLRNVEIAKKFNTTLKRVQSIKNGDTFSSVTCKQKEETRLTKQIVLEIFNSPLSHKELGERFNIYHNNVYKIKAGKIWSSVTGKHFKT